jgi:hypothetical protein
VNRSTNTKLNPGQINFFGWIMRKNSLRKSANRYLRTDHRGSPRSRKFRYYVIHNLIKELFTIGNAPSHWKALTNQHLEQLSHQWKARKIKPSTIMNHLTVIRKFLQIMGNHNVLISNKNLGITRYKSQKRKWKNDPDFWLKAEEPSSKILLGLQAHFGLTLSEALRLIPDIHIQQHNLWLTSEITT